MPKRKLVSEVDTKERILTAATEVFATIGYAGARVDEIAERAGVNKAMLYYHVGDKEQLYVTVLTGTIGRVMAALEEAIAPLRTPAEKIEAILRTLTRLGSENRLFIPMVLREIASGGTNLPDEMISRMSSVFGLVSGVLAEGAESGAFRRVDPLLTHVAIIGATMFLVASTAVRRRVAAIAGVPPAEHSPAQLAEHLGALFLRGLEAGGAPQKPPAGAAAKKQGRKRS